MPFKDFRDFLVWVFKNHSPKHMTIPNGRVAIYAEPLIDLSTGLVFAIKFKGADWEKTISTLDRPDTSGRNLRERCIAFLAGEGSPNEPQVKMTSLEKIAEIIDGEVSRSMAHYGEEFGSDSITFKIPLKLLTTHLKDEENANKNNAGSA